MRFLVPVAVLIIAQAALSQEKKFTVEFDLGNTWMTKNEVRIPRVGGTQFPFADILGRGAFRFSRVEVTWEGSEGSGWRLLYAPLSIKGTGRFSSPVTYNGSTFAAGVDTDGRYAFNSYRLTYRNRWKKTAKTDLRAGFTLKVRDAEVALQQGSTSSSYKNTGVVPLAHIYLEQQLGGRWSLLADMDALGGGPGYAIDAGARVAYRAAENMDWVLGVRALDGGANAKDVYNFATFTYLHLGVRLRF